VSWPQGSVPKGSRTEGKEESWRKEEGQREIEVWDREPEYGILGRREGWGAA